MWKLIGPEGKELYDREAWSYAEKYEQGCLVEW